MKNTFKVFGIVLAAFLIFTLSACDNGSSSDDTQENLEGTVSITGGTDGVFYADDTATADVSKLNVTTGLKYQWKSSDEEAGTFAAITGETGATYTITNGMVGRWIKVTVSHADYNGEKTSGAIEISPEATDMEGYITIPNTIVVGNLIYADLSNLEFEKEESWSTPDKYQWQVSDTKYGTYTDIEDGDTPNYEVAVEVGKWIRVVVGNTGNTGTVTSNVCQVVAPGAKVVISVTITSPESSPENPASVSKGGSIGLSVLVEGDNVDPYDFEDQAVTWEVGKKTKPGTYVDAGMFASELKVAVDEEADELILIATSVLDKNISSEPLTITLTPPEGKIIKITSMTGLSGEFEIILFDSLVPYPYGTEVTRGTGTIDNGTLMVIPIAYDENYNPEPWDGDGEFYIKITRSFSSPNSFFSDIWVYTEGDALDQSDWDANATLKIEDTDTTVEINFNQFKLVEQGVGGHEFTVSGLGSFNGEKAFLELLVEGEYGVNLVATGHAIISSGSITITLSDAWAFDDGFTSWEGEDGDYYLRLTIFKGMDATEYVYTEGKSLTELNIGTTWADYWDKAPTFEIDSDTGSSTVDFDQFKDGSGFDVL
jgi:uncharacterized lipoprotein YehR (DUF1307 family)